MKLASYIFLFLIIFIGNVCIKESHASDPENESGSIFTRSYKEDEKPRNNKKKTTITNRENEIQQIKKQIERLVDNDLKYIVENIFEFFGSFNSVFIFDCEQPSYIDSSNQLVRLKSSLKEELKKIGKCDRKDFVWHDVLDQDKMLGFSYSRKNITKSLYEIREILKLFNRHNACDDLLKFLKHPSMSLRNYEKPLECKSNNKSFSSNIKSSDADNESVLSDDSSPITSKSSSHSSSTTYKTTRTTTKPKSTTKKHTYPMYSFTAGAKCGPGMM